MNKVVVFVLSLALCIHTMLVAEKILILTTVYNRPDFIEIQDKTFKKFLKDEYRFVVFNDAKDKAMQARIQETCTKLGIACISIPQEIHDQPYLLREPNDDFHNPSVRCCNAVQYALNTLGFHHDGIVAFLDSDMFLVKDFSIKKYLKGYQIAGLPQVREKNGRRIPYLWIGILFMDMTKLPHRETINVNCGHIADVPVDAGGFTHYYLKKYPKTKVKYLDHFHSLYLGCSDCLNGVDKPNCTHNRVFLEAQGFDEQQISSLHAGLHDVEFFIRASFFHYRCGTNWNGKTQSYHDEKTRHFNDYIHKISQSDPSLH